MLIAAAIQGERKLLVIGLSETNIEKLKNDQPILKHLDGSGEDNPVVEGLEEWDVVILGPEDTPRFIAAVEPGRLDEFLKEWT